MRIIALSLLTAIALSAAIHCPIGADTPPAGIVCNNTYPATSAGFQSADTAAADGDFIYLRAGDPAAYQNLVLTKQHTTPVTVSSIQAAWLPCAFCRVTPADQANTAIITGGATAYDVPLIRMDLDGSGNFAKGYNLVGLTFWYGPGKGAEASGPPWKFNNGVVATGGSHITLDYVFNGTTITGSTSGASATVTLTGVAVSNHLVNFLFQVNESAGNWIPGVYTVVSTSGSTITLDRNVSTAAATGLGTNGAGNSFLIVAQSSYTNEFANFTCDRCFIRDAMDDVNNRQFTTNGFWLNGHGHTIKNSYLWPIGHNPNESHGVIGTSGTCPNGLNSSDTNFITNTFLSVAGIAFFSAGTASEYEDGANQCWNIQYNLLHKPYKYWPSGLTSPPPNGSICKNPDGVTCFATGNPKPAYYNALVVADTPCSKNGGEFKSTNGAIVQYNQHERMWPTNYCQGQDFGLTISPRDINAWSNAAAGLTATSGANSFTLATTAIQSQLGNYLMTFTPGSTDITRVPLHYTICVSGALSFECHRIATWNPGTKSGTIYDTWLANYSGVNVDISQDWFYLDNVTIRNNALVDFPTSISILFRDRWNASNPGKVNWSKVTNLTINNNLFTNSVLLDDSYTYTGQQILKMTTDEIVPTWDRGNVGSNIFIYHNSWRPKVGTGYVSGVSLLTQYASLMSGQTNPPTRPQPAIDVFDMHSNLFPEAVDVAHDGNHYSTPNASTGFSNRVCNVEATITTSGNWGYNAWPWAFQTGSAWGYGCSNVSVTGNVPGFSGSTAAWYPNTARLLAGNAYAKAANDGTDMGVNEDQLALIRNLKVTTSSTTALLEFDLSAPIKDAGNTQPCVLQVAADNASITSGGEVYQSYLGAWPTPIPDLNPTFFKQATASNRSNVLLPTVLVVGQHVSWPLGGTGSVTGDDSVLHDLRLTPSKLYWGQLMCYGAATNFQFTTLAGTSGTTSVPVVAPGTLSVNYGPTAAMGSTVSGSNSVSIPVTAGTPLYYQITRGGNLLPQQIVLP